MIWLVLIAIIALVWGFALGFCFARLNMKRPAIWLIQGEIELFAAFAAGLFLESLLILGAIFL